jgi:hypothetical protein
MLRIFSPEKSDGFGQVRTHNLGYQRPACLYTTEAATIMLAVALTTIQIRLLPSTSLGY